MTITHNRQFSGIWIPAEIWLADGLNALEKILLVEVNSLDNERGCVAGNDYFAGFLGVTTIRVSQMIKKLKDEKYIYEASFDGRTRTLKSNIKVIIKQSKDDYKAGLKEILRQNEENAKPVLKEIINNSNTVNNQSNNPFSNKDTASGFSQSENSVSVEIAHTQKQKKESEIEVIPNCIDISKWEEWKNYKKEKKQKLTKSTADKQLKNLQKWHLEGQDPNEIIDNSISNGWAGLFPLKQQKSTFNNQNANTKPTKDYFANDRRHAGKTEDDFLNDFINSQ